MIALDYIAKVNPKKVFELLPQIISTTNKGSDIIRNHEFGILVTLSKDAIISETTFPLLVEQ